MNNGQVIEAITSTQSKTVHARLKRPIASLYSNTNTLTYQPQVADTIRYFFRRIDEEFIRDQNAGRPCDIDNWLQYFAFDVVGRMTISRPLGFLEKGHDIDGMLNTELSGELNYRSIVGNIPWVDKWLKKNPIYVLLFKPTSFFAARSKRLIGERM